MTVIRADWAGANQSEREKSGPEIYAPPVRRAPELPINSTEPMPLRRADEASQPNDPTEYLNSLVRRIAAASLDDIDNAMRELEILREMLQKESQRVSRNVADYASLSLASMNAIKKITEHLRQLNSARY